MRYTELISDYLHLDVALEKIKNNTSSSYRWFSVKNKANSFFEIGGRKNEFKAYIPETVNGKISVYANGFVNGAYSINNQNEIEFSTYQLSHDMNEKELIKFLDETNFFTYKPEILEEEIEEINYRTIRKFIK